MIHEHLFDTVHGVPLATAARRSPTGVQGSFDDLGTPLRDVTFCVVDVETTGGSAADGAITEIGAVKLRGGECLGTLQTLVNPGQAIPPQITMLTGITQAMVAPAPRMHTVLPSFLEFLGDAVLVGHNVRYDISFLQSELSRAGQRPLTNRTLDTCALARRLVRDEVPNCKLGTLAERLRLAHRPSHRALDDALATGDLLHLLIERAGTWGVFGLDDLIDLPKLAGHPQAGKLRLTEHLPRLPGVYIFRDVGGRALYVGKATNLRSRVRSYFSGDTRRKVGSLLREAQAIDHIVCRNPLEAAVREIRLIHELEPRFNRQATTWRSYVYLRLTDDRFPRLSVVRVPPPDDSLHLGPLPSTRFATRVAEAVQTVVPLRRCSARPPSTPVAAPCTSAQLGVATCPCAGAITPEAYRALTDSVRRGLSHAPAELLDPLAGRLRDLAADERYEEAADTRDRAAALSQALQRHRRFSMWRGSGRVVLSLPDGSGVELLHGRLVHAWDAAGGPPAPSLQLQPDEAPHGTVARDEADELLCVGQWLDREAANVRLLHADGVLASPLPRLARFEPGARGRP